MFPVKLKLSGSYGDFLYTLSLPLYGPFISQHPLSDWFISLRLKKTIVTNRIILGKLLFRANEKNLTFKQFSYI